LSQDSLRLVSATVAPMYRAPTPLSEQVSQALLGMPVLVLDDSGPYCRVRSPDGYEGWGQSELLDPLPAGWGPPWVECVDLLVNLRAENHSQLASVLRVPIGCHLPLVGEAPGWAQVLVPDGRRLWTEAHRVRAVRDASRRAPRPAAICRTARRFLGIPYLWGGCSPLGLDCSGFLQLVLRLHGIELLRDADQQFGQGQPIDEPGAADLVFFGPEESPGRITHVGMMLDVRRYIHAAGSDRVRINLLQRGARYRGARRFIQP